MSNSLGFNTHIYSLLHTHTHTHPHTHPHTHTHTHPHTHMQVEGACTSLQGLDPGWVRTATVKKYPRSLPVSEGATSLDL